MKLSTMKFFLFRLKTYTHEANNAISVGIQKSCYNFENIMQT